jgi:hypothetical protein
VAEEAQTMIYRKVMVERYAEYLYEHFWQGWGLTTVPKIKGMESIDNAFFLMALQHGAPAPVIFLFIFLYAIGSQVAHGLKAPPGVAPLGFTFAGVYMGAQTEPLLFLFLGWGEGIKARAPERTGETGAKQSGELSPRPGFRRVLG